MSSAYVVHSWGTPLAILTAESPETTLADGRLVTLDQRDGLPDHDAVQIAEIADVPVSSPDDDHVDAGYSLDVADLTITDLGEENVELQRDRWVFSREQQWRPMTVAEARQAAEERRGYIALTVHSRLHMVPLTGISGLSGVQVDTNPAGEYVGWHPAEPGCVLGMSMAEPSAAGYLPHELVHAGTGYWAKIATRQDSLELPPTQYRDFTLFRVIAGQPAKTRLNIQHQYVKGTLLDPYSDESWLRQTAYENDRRTLEVCEPTVAAYQALFR